MFLNQYLLTKSLDFIKKINGLDWNQESIEYGDFILFYHPNLNLIKNSTGNSNLYLIGSLYDWEFPELTNQEIIDQLSIGSISTLFDRVSKYCGEFVIIFASEESLIVFNDATGQKEIYYDLLFESVGSQVSLLAYGIEVIPHDNKQAIEFYDSEIFKKRRLFVGDSTHVKNVRHLICNHFIDLHGRIVKRFYPNKDIVERLINDVAKDAATMIKGYLAAISHRHQKIALAVTGGYDSRVLFLASLKLSDKKFTYYVLKHSSMSDSHYDISLARKLTEIYDKNLLILDASKIPRLTDISDMKNSLDFPPDEALEDALNGHVYINGNVYEIARSVFGNEKSATAEDLTFILGYRNLRFPTIMYKKWLKNKSIFEKYGYHYLDFLYWEERMGIWLSKSRTEQYGLNKAVISPYNSRQLVEILLSVNKKYRGRHYNTLQNKIVAIMSGDNSEITSMPINPTLKRKFYIALYKMNLYNTFRYVGLKLRLF